MKKKFSAGDRALRIELTRARAALERQSLARDAGNLRESLKPTALLGGLLPKLVFQTRSLGWLGRGLFLTRRYPLLTSAASALVSSLGGRHRWWRLGAGLLLGWQLAHSSRRSKKGPR